MEQRTFVYSGKEYRIVLERKRISSFRIRYNEKQDCFFYSYPYFASKRQIEDELQLLLPKIMKHFSKVDPVKEDDVYLFGEKKELSGYSLLSEAKREKFLKSALLDFLERRVPELISEMKPTRNYSVKVRNMSSRYGVNNRNSLTLTFALSLVHYAPEIIDSVIVHEIAHDFYFDHSEKFYSVVYTYCPNYKLLHNYLRKKNYAGKD